MSAIAISHNRDTFLRRVLWLDAATCLVMGLALLSLADTLSPLLGLPAGLLEAAGFALPPIAGFMIWTATRETPPRAAVRMVIAGNAAWIAGSLALLAPGWLGVTPAGCAFVVAQALGVLVLAVLEYLGARRL